jgi:hypothetical protein
MRLEIAQDASGAATPERESDGLDLLRSRLGPAEKRTLARLLPTNRA